MDSGRLVFGSAASPCRAAGAGGGQMLLFGGHGGFLGGERSVESQSRSLVAVWFQNRRARWKTKQLELDFDRLRAAHDELLAGRDALLADNESLRSQVILLTEKLQANERSSPAPAEPTAVPDTVHATVLAAGSPEYQLEEGDLYAGITTNGGAAMPAPAPLLAPGRVANNDSPESYFAGARSPPSSSEDDCGVGDEDPSSSALLRDAVLVGAALEHAVELATAADEEAPLNSWELFWN
ncbi:hypothetical protein E2562_035930 [Oryza meyeriana var. granulata]|uniref:Homeobox-leucine zipper protein n=1 Tax=Oryza meyeriana var. granulata TaxID=110450 RepID=A0A6G1DS77_9ORYZ|nr:hypothetical protein E2562_035930 [Oryza meyeriana var. granulata]